MTCQNETLLTYFSHLVEQGYMDSLQLNFMVVGHTHANIDQIFSSFTKFKKKATFIGTPAALFHYLKTHGQGSRCYRCPIVCEKLDVLFDYVGAFKSYRNTSIKYYQIPHKIR